MVEIREFDLQNVMVHYKWNNDPKLTYYDSEEPYRPESFDDFLKRIKSVIDARNTSAELYEIYLSSSNKLIGVADIYAIDRYNCRCYINCTIADPDYPEQEYKTEAMRKVLEYCFEGQGMQKVAATAFDFNTGWIETIHRLGFRKEGQLRNHVLKSGTFCDKLIYSQLKTEYEAARGLPCMVAAG